jgi:hypothetical protein
MDFKFFKGYSKPNIEIGYERVPNRISYRHWNLLPQDIKEGPEEEMLIYIQGWETPRNRVVINPYLDNFRLGNIWTRGWSDRQRR